MAISGTNRSKCCRRCGLDCSHVIAGRVRDILPSQDKDW